MKNQNFQPSSNHIYPTTPEELAKAKKEFDSFKASCGTITIKLGENSSRIVVDCMGHLSPEKILRAVSELIRPLGYTVIPDLGSILPMIIGGVTGMNPSDLAEVQPTKVVPLATGGSLQVFDFPLPGPQEEPFKEIEDKSGPKSDSNSDSESN